MGSVYTLIPRPIGIFAGLDMTSRYAFGLIYDRWQLSHRKANKDRFTDPYGVYCVFSREAMAAEMGVSLPTLRKAIKELLDREIVYSRLFMTGGAWRYYIPQNILDEIECLEQDLPTPSDFARICGG